MHAYLTLLGYMLTMAAAPERILLLQDSNSNNLEQTVVHHSLVQSLVVDPSVDIWLGHPLAESWRRALNMRPQVQTANQASLQALEHMQPQQAAMQAAQAAQKAQRIAALTGDTTLLHRAWELQSVAYLWLGKHTLAQKSLQRLLAIDPDYTPNPTLFNPKMRQAVGAARQKLHSQKTQTICIEAFPDEAAIFVDNRFMGFGRVEVELNPNFAHFVTAVAAEHQPQAQYLPVGLQDVALPLHVNLVPQIAQAQQAQAKARLVENCAHDTSFPDPSMPLLRAWQIDTVLVLSYHDGILRLTTFDLRQGQRHTTEAQAAITELRDAWRTAASLRRGAPDLTALPIGTQSSLPQ